MFYFLMALILLSPKDPKWFEVSSDHFLLFTDTNEMKGRRLLTDLENRVAAFSRAFGQVPPRQYPIEVFLFKENQDFIEALPHVKPPDPNVVTVRQPVGPRGLPPGFPGGGGGVPRDPGIPGGGGTPGGGGVPGSIGLPPGAGNPFPDRSAAEEQLSKAAYLVRGPDRIFIVARDKSPDAIVNDVGHALGHVLFERYAIWRPFWLAEGAAEYLRKIGRGAETKPIESVAVCAAHHMTWRDPKRRTARRRISRRATRP